MKKLLLLLMPVFAATGLVNAQLQGYSWYFSSSPFNSTPAVTTSAVTYTLTEVGSGAPMTLGGTASVGLGTSCTGPVNVGQFAKPYGLQFSNSPQLVTTSYTIEMVASLTDIATNAPRLFGFADNTSDVGVYISFGGGNITFFDGTTNNDINMTPALAANTWYHFVFVRNGATKDVKVYVDGTLRGTYNDASDLFVPQVANSNLITFFKDNQDNTEESSGSVARLSVFNDTISPIKVDSLFNNVCNTSFKFVAPNFNRQGYQWTFGTAPYNAAAADAGSTSSANASLYPLSTVGSGSISTLNTSVGLGTSCAGNIDVGSYLKPFGFELNIGNSAPQFIDSTYTIELVLKTGDFLNAVRLIGFDDVSDDGIYIDAAGGTAGDIIFSENGTPHFVGSLALTANTWYSFVFTRDAATKDINFYINNTLGGTYNDATNVFVAHESNGYNIRLLKDDVDNTEESDGQIAKAAFFNRVLDVTQLTERYDNICNTNLIVLPVSLKSFNAQKVGKKVELTWTTATEQNNLGFEVQRSTNGSDYTAIGFVKGVGTSANEVTYHFTDEAPLNGKSYYRLKQINIDNRFKLSAVRLIDFAKDIQDLQVYPNPAHSILTVVNLKAGNTLHIFDSFGRLVQTRKAADTQETISVESLSSGVYVLQVTDNNGTKRSIRFTRF